MAIDKLQPAPKEQLVMYGPYYPQQGKKNILPYAFSLYKTGSLEGERKIEGGESIPFVATWNVSSLPADLTRCRIQFDGNSELSYEMTMATFEFVDYLIDVVLNFKRSRLADFSQTFYRRLMKYDDPTP